MAYENNGKNDADDSFWNFEDLPVKKVPAKSVSDTPKFDIGTVLLELNKREGVNPNGGALIKRASEISRPVEKSARIEYSPDSSLIKNVKIDPWPSRYTFYSRFREGALQLDNVKPALQENVPFFSYLPQFSQMNSSQLSFYRFFRSLLKNKEYIHADLSYIMLYIYEIINIPEKYPPEEGLNTLCDIWLAYRAKYPKLDRYLGEWVCDYCLIHRLPCPNARLAPIINSIIKFSSLKEFYLGKDDVKAFYRAVYSFESEYNFFSSKYIKPENTALFEKHIPEAFIYACEIIAESDPRFGQREDSFAESKQIRDAFSAALCAYEIKKKLEIEYLAYSRRSILRPIVTDLVKYAENCLRKRIGVRARMSTLFLDERMKSAVDRYFELNLPEAQSEKVKGQKREEKSEFEKLYEPASVGISAGDALNIEAKSWENAKELVGEFETYAAEPVPAPANAEKEDESVAFVKNALRLILNGDQAGLSALAEDNFMMKETLIECVNEFCYDLLNDVAVVTENGRTYIIPDYIGEIKECLKS